MTLKRLEMTALKINNKINTSYTLLDAGCRTKDLLPFLDQEKVQYFGTDIVPGDNVLQCDLQKNLSFKDKEFDVVVALDVLEHLDNPHFTIKELMRVGKKYLYISLPNMYHFTFRYNFLRGKGISGKYSFHPYPVIDRHKWILSYTEALEFIKHNTAECKYNIYNILPNRGRTKYISAPIEKFFSKIFPNFFVYGVLFEIKLE